jgi:hypothetical protein
MRRIHCHSFLALALAGTLLGLAAGAPASAATGRIEVSAAHASVGEGEPIELRLRVQGDGDGAPDLSVLEQDFQILGVSQMQSTTIVNGRVDQHRDWTVQLLPLHGGSQRIPPITLGGDPATASAPFEVAVRAASNPSDDSSSDAATPGGGRPDVIVETTVDDASPYVQGQVQLKVDLLSTEPILSGQLTDPQIEGASVERMGEDRSYTTTRNGREYSVIERSFVVFPQQSGKLEISPVAFEGQVRDEPRRPAQRRRGSFGRLPSPFGSSLFDEMQAMLQDDFFGPSAADTFFGRGGRTVRAVSEPLVVNVKPRPAQADARWWLPAEAVKLTEEWDSTPDTLQVGEQVTRSLIVQALGVSRDQIPEIDLPPVDGLKQYREPAVDQTVQTDDGLAALKVQKTVVIATRPGDYVLPQVELSWWDTASDRARTATLPERHIRVVPAAGEATPSLAQMPPPTLPDAGPNGGGPGAPDAGPNGGTPGAPDASGATTTGIERVLSDSRWELGAALLAAVGMATFAAWLMVRRARVGRDHGAAARGAGDERANAEGGRQALRGAEQRLRRACTNGDAGAALQALRDVAVASEPVTPQPGPGLAGLVDRLGDPALRAEVEALQRARFAARNDTPWDGAGLWDAYQRVRRTSSGRASRGESEAPRLPGLYPQQSA